MNNTSNQVTATNSQSSTSTSGNGENAEFNVHFNADDLLPNKVRQKPYRRYLSDKEAGAFQIAQMIIQIFRHGLYGSLGIVVLLIVVFAIPGIQIATLLDSIGSLLEIITVIGAVFSPLLAFILGYYYNRSHGDNS